MSNFEQQPKKELSLETPEQADERLGKLPQSEPQSVDENLQGLVTDAETQVAADMQRTNELLEEIKAMPVISDEVPDTSITQPLSQKTEQPAPAKKSFLDKLKFWKQETVSSEAMTAQAQEDLRKLLKANDFGKVAAFSSSVEKKLGMTDSREWDEAFGPIIQEATLRMIQSGDGKNFNKMLSSDMNFLGVDNILPENGRLKSGELRNPEIVQAVKEYFTAWINEFSGSNTRFIDAFASHRDYWVQKGFVTAEEINELPAVKKKIKNDIINVAKSMFDKNSTQGDPAGRFDAVKQQWEAQGVSRGEIEAWPEIQKLEA